MRKPATNDDLNSMMSLTQGKRGRGGQPDSHPGSASRRLSRSGGPRWKRGLDLGVVALTAPFWVPLLLGIGATIKLQSRGAVLLRQERVGLRGRRFGCLQFRTMRAGLEPIAPGESRSGPVSSGRPMIPGNPQVSPPLPLAGVLHATGLAYLPELFNVLRGEMSLVGPRPGTPEEYNTCSRGQRARAETLPGVTGLWQVTGRDRTTYPEMIELDLQYVRSLCLGSDLGILLRTAPALLGQIAGKLRQRWWHDSVPREFLPSQAANPPAPRPVSCIPPVSLLPHRRLSPCAATLLRSHSLQPVPGGIGPSGRICANEFCQQFWH